MTRCVYKARNRTRPWQLICRFERAPLSFRVFGGFGRHVERAWRREKLCISESRVSLRRRYMTTRGELNQKPCTFSFFFSSFLSSFRPFSLFVAMPRPPAAPSQPSMAHLNRQSTSSSTSSLENSNEIVARDQTGTYKTDIPTLPSLSPTGGQVHAAQLPVDVEVELTANRSDKDSQFPQFQFPRLCLDLVPDMLFFGLSPS